MRGSVRRRGNIWQVRVSLGRDPETGRYEYASRYVHGTKRDAQRACAELITEVDRGGHREEGRHTVNELLDRWMAHIEAQGRAESTLARYRSCINANIKPRLGAKAINKLGPADLDRYYAQLGRTGLTPLSVRKSHAILSAAFNQALRWGWLDTNPVLRSSPPTHRVREIHPPTREELRRLLEACANDHEDLGSIIYVAATTGARRGELCGLRWTDLDLDLATMTIARSISDANQLVAVKDTKTHQARRIALDPSTVKVLRAHRELVDQRAAKADIGLLPTAYVWSQDLDGATPYRPDRVTGAFRALRDRLELSHVTFHSLRHFTATTLAAGGVGIRTIAGRLGHANPGITLRTYAHFLDAADREAAIAIGDALVGLQPAAANRPSASSRARRGTTSRRPNRTEGSSRLATKS
ncbi:MAG TPA: tyrosine-type recombinase/integrase [Acidimicrobiales bacterium]|nr:tyrosine-type recombinase/integrase [Acidimicrobiales bacterium]